MKRNGPRNLGVAPENAKDTWGYPTITIRDSEKQKASQAKEEYLQKLGGHKSGWHVWRINSEAQ